MMRRWCIGEQEACTLTPLHWMTFGSKSPALDDLWSLPPSYWGAVEEQVRHVDCCLRQKVQGARFGAGIWSLWIVRWERMSWLLTPGLISRLVLQSCSRMITGSSTAIHRSPRC